MKSDVITYVIKQMEKNTNSDTIKRCNLNIFFLILFMEYELFTN